MADAGVFSGQYGDDASWQYLTDLYTKANQEWAATEGKKAGAGGKDMTTYISEQTGMTPDEVKAVEMYTLAKAQGQSLPTWTREDLWRRVGPATGRIQAQQASKASANEEARVRGDITTNIQKFIDGLGADAAGTKRMQDLIARKAQAQQGASASRAGLGSVGSGGVGGGLSEMGRASIAGDLNTKYDLQRQGLQAQAMGLLNQRDLGLSQLDLQYTQLQNQQAEAQWAAQKNQAQGIGSAIGAGVGALGFIGGPALGAATMGAGSALGGGLGGLATGGSGPSYQAPRPTSGTFRGGSLGGTGY
jgi:hypothetical protein